MSVEHFETWINKTLIYIFFKKSIFSLQSPFGVCSWEHLACQMEADTGPTLGSPVINSSASYISTFRWRHRHVLTPWVIINSARNISCLKGCTPPPREHCLCVMILGAAVTSRKEKQQFAHNNKHGTHMRMHRWRNICTRNWHAGSHFLTYPQRCSLRLDLACASSPVLLSFWLSFRLFLNSFPLLV